MNYKLPYQNKNKKMNYYTIFEVTLIILLFIVGISFITSLVFITATPGNKLSFGDKRQKSKILNFLRLR